MKNRKLLLVLLFVFPALSIFAQPPILRVNNNPNSTAQFNDLQQAVNAADDFTIIQVEGSDQSYGTVFVDRPLSIEGPGYFMNQNFDNKYQTNSAFVDQIFLSQGVENVKVSGMSVGEVNINAISAELVSNRIGNLDASFVDELKLFNNFFGQFIEDDVIANIQFCQLVELRGNIFTGNLEYAPITGGFGETSFKILLRLSQNEVSTVSQNTFSFGTSVLNQATVTGNIFVDHLIGGLSNSTFDNNLFTDGEIVTQFDEQGNPLDPASLSQGINNGFNLDALNSFEDSDSFDKRYLIIDGSEPDNYWDQGNAGANFDGGYRISGLPTKPIVFQLNVTLDDEGSGLYLGNVRTTSQNGISLGAYQFSTDNGFGQGDELLGGEFSQNGVVTTFFTDQIDTPTGNIILLVRFQNLNGDFGHTEEIELFKSPLPVDKIVASLQIMFNDQFGYDDGIFIPLTNQQTEIDFDINIPAGTLSPGFQTIATRIRDSNGNFSVTQYRPIIILPEFEREDATVEYLEYFFDVDPGYGMATQLDVQQAQEIDVDFVLPVPTDLEIGPHKLFFRTRDDLGRYSIAQVRDFYVQSSVFGDVNNDGTVNIQDLLQIIGVLGTPDPASDLDRDPNSLVNTLDLVLCVGALGTP